MEAAIKDIPIEYKTPEYRDKYQRDSIYLVDSTVVDKWMNKTLYLSQKKNSGTYRQNTK